MTGEEFLIKLDDAINTSLVVLSILESAEKGIPVKVEYFSSD